MAFDVDKDIFSDLINVGLYSIMDVIFSPDRITHLGNEFCGQFSISYAPSILHAATIEYIIISVRMVRIC
jgi:hypothetical protein